MHQLRLTTLHARDIGHPFSRLFVTAIGLMTVLTALAVVLFVLVPIIGVILSAAVGGAILALAGIMLMTPLLLVTGTVYAWMSRSHGRRGAGR